MTENAEDLKTHSVDRFHTLCRSFSHGPNSTEGPSLSASSAFSAVLIPLSVVQGCNARLEVSVGLVRVLRMPLYEFHCEKCGKDSEILVRSSNWDSTPCPHCDSTRLTKKFSTFASSLAGQSAADPSCSGTPRSCGMCGTGKPHKH
jgi:putative FmdB family regulatory protein